MPSVAAYQLRLVVCAAVILCASPSLAGHAVAGEGAQDSAASGQPVVVEADGFAPMTPGKALDAAHREALLDARRNALIQAHVTVEADANVADMRLTETVVRSRAAGYVQKMDILESGLVPGFAPPSYRVRVRAVVQPLPPFAGLPPQGVGADRWQPALMLRMTSDLPPEKEALLGSELAQALRRCGIALVQPEQGRPALSGSISVSAARSEGNAGTKVSYEIGIRLARPEGPGEQEALPSAGGQWLAAETVTLQGEWWQRVAVAMAQDATRLWAMPRPTVIRFLGLDDAAAKRMSAALASVPGSRWERAADYSEVQITLTIGGDPLSAIEPLIRSAEVSVTLDPAQTSLTRLTYKALPRPQPAIP